MKVFKAIIVAGTVTVAACYLSRTAEANHPLYQSQPRSTQKKRASGRTRRKPSRPNGSETAAKAPAPLVPNVPQIIYRAESHFRNGKVLLEQNQVALAREEFDKAVDSILESGIDVRSSEQIKSFYEDLIDRIFREELSVEGQGFRRQEFTPSPLDELSKLVLTPNELMVTDADVLTLERAKQTINFAFKLNPVVQQYVNYYQGRGRNKLERSLKQSGRYMKTATVIFNEEGVPVDIAWMAQVLSEWNPRAISITGASGLWQLSEETGRQMTLRRTEWIDERLDLEKSTRAVAKLLRTLAARYNGNWELAISAYRAGPLVIDSAIRQAGAADFWRIYPYLPSDIRSYLPSVLATMLIAKNPSKYGFGTTTGPLPSNDVLSVPPATSLGLIAYAGGISIEELRSINPQLLRDVTPNEVCILQVPRGKGKQVDAFLKRLTSSSASTNSSRSTVKSGRQNTPAEEPNSIFPPGAGIATCNLTADQAPELRGFRLGMSINDALKKVPDLVFSGTHNELREDQFSMSDIQDESGSVTIRIDVVQGSNSGVTNQPERSSSKTSAGEYLATADAVKFPHLEGVQSITLWFLDNYLSTLSIEYERGLKWKTIQEFSSKVSEKLRLPGLWKIDPHDAGSSTLFCDGLIITAATVRPLNLGPRKASTLTLRVPTKWNVLVRREFQIEKRAEQEKKDSFVP